MADTQKKEDTFKSILNIEKIYARLIDENGKFADSRVWDVKELALTAQVGGILSCNIIILPDKKDTITTYEMKEESQKTYMESGYAAVFCDYTVEAGAKETCCLFRGFIYSHSNMVSITGNAYSYGRGVELVSDLKTLDTLPLGQLYAGRVDEDEHILKQSRFGQANSGRSLIAAASASGNINKLLVAPFAASILDNGFNTAQNDKKGSITLANPNKKISSAIDVDNGPVIDIPVSNNGDTNGYAGAYMEIANSIADSYSSAPPITIFSGILSTFYQMIVPRFPENATALSTEDNKMQIIPNLAWKKTTIDSNHSIDLSDILYMQQYSSDGKPTEINGVVVDTSLGLQGSQKQLTRSYYLCAEDKVTGKINSKSVTELQSDHIVYDRLFLARLPKWLQYDIYTGVQTSDDIKKSWSEFIARTVYSSMNRSNDKVTVGIPFLKFIAIRNYIGDLCKVFVPSDSADAALIGRLDTINLKITIGESISYSADIVLTHVRTAKENDNLSIDVKGFVTRDGK